MPDLSAYAVTAASTPRRTDDSTMAVLYRAALGPIGTARYLTAFERFDNAGRTLPGWNWAAALCTLNWMLFRRLWGAALVYVAALEGLALLAVAVGHYTGRLPMPVLAGIGLAVLLAATVIPGLYGHAIVHGDVRKRITKALSASATLAQAKARLEQHAPTQRRLVWIAAANAVLWLLLAALVVLKPFPQAAPLTVRAGTTGVPGPAAADSGATTASTPAVAPASAASRPAASDDAPRAAAAAAPTAPSSSAASASPARVASGASPPERKATAEPSAPSSAASAAVSASAAPVPAPVATASQSVNPATVHPAPDTRPAASAAVAAPARAASAGADTASSPGPAPAPSPPTGPRASRPAPPSPPQRAATTAPARSTAPASTSDRPDAAALRKLYINVGLFAEPANARRAHGLLRGAGLPAATQKVTAADGRELLRVRAGPFTSTSQANGAAARIRAMGLETSAASSQRQ